MATYNPLQSIVLTSSATEVTFSGIDQSYTDLIVVMSAQNVSNSGADFYVRFNGDSGSNYSRLYLVGDGSSASSANNTNQSGINIFSLPSSGATFTPVTLHLNNYSNTTTYKTALVRASGVTPYMGLIAGTWRNTSAVTSITIGYANSLNAGSTFDLYGIKSGAPQAFGGDTVTTDGNYWYHTFRSTGAFIPQRPLTVDYLVVAGGGGGGYDTGGGGGAGGLRCTVTATGGGGSLESALSVSNQTYTVTIGAGGTGSTSGSAKGTNGTNSVFGSITSIGGGGGGSDLTGSGADGGSGGGKVNANRTGSGGLGTANQGYNGGTSTFLNGGGSGGGGAGAAGTGSTSTTGGVGGNGIATTISGTSTFYAGGGGGGGGSATNPSGGSGGGGAGGSISAPGSGSANTGGGGGGGRGSTTLTGAAGGSGIVIVRYAV